MARELDVRIDVTGTDGRPISDVEEITACVDPLLMAAIRCLFKDHTDSQIVAGLIADFLKRWEAMYGETFISVADIDAIVAMLPDTPADVAKLQDA